MSEDSMPSKRMVPAQQLSELSDEIALLKADFQNASDAADEWCEKFDSAAEEIRVLTEQRDILTDRLEELVAFTEQRDRAMKVVEAAREVVRDQSGVTARELVELSRHVAVHVQPINRLASALAALDAEAAADTAPSLRRPRND